jgi:hypothetical protein
MRNRTSALPLDALADGEVLEIEIDGREIALYRVEDAELSGSAEHPMRKRVAVT